MGYGNVDKVQGKFNQQVLLNQSKNNFNAENDELRRLLAGHKSDSEEMKGILVQQKTTVENNLLDTLPLAELEKRLIQADNLMEKSDINRLKLDLQENKVELVNMKKTGSPVSKNGKTKEQIEKEIQRIDLQLKIAVEVPSITTRAYKRDLKYRIFDKATKLLKEGKLSKEEKSKLLELFKDDKSEYIKLLKDEISKSMPTDTKSTK